MAFFARSFGEPEESNAFPNGHEDVISIAGRAIGLATFEPGWRWSNDIRPLVGTDLCRVCDAGVPKPNGWGQNLRGQTQKRRSVRQAKPTYAEAELMRREHAKHVHAARKETTADHAKSARAPPARVQREAP